MLPCISLLLAACFSSLASAEGCVHPDIDKLLEPSKGSVVLENSDAAPRTPLSRMIGGLPEETHISHGDGTQILSPEFVVMPAGPPEGPKSSKIPLAKMPKEPEIIFETSLFTIFFDSNLHQLNDSEISTIARIIHQARQRPKKWIIVTGHADSSGSDSANLNLSRLRAESVATMLLRHKIAPDRICIEYRGEKNPLIETGNGIPKQLNRRVEVQFI